MMASRATRSETASAPLEIDYCPTHASDLRCLKEHPALLGGYHQPIYR
jgi:hypothetical protein